MRCASPIFFLLPMVPCASSPITRVSLAFRARLRANSEAVKTRTCHPSQDAGQNAKENSGPLGTNRKRKPLLYSLTKTEYSSNNATAATFSQTLVSVIGYIRSQDRVILPIPDCCLVPLKKYITFSL